MSENVLKDDWIRWFPKKIFLKNVNNNYKNYLYTKKIIKKKLYTDINNNDFNDSKESIKNVQQSRLNDQEIKLLKEEAYQTGFTVGYKKYKSNEKFFKDKLKKLFIDFEHSLLACENLLFSHLLKIVLTVSAYVVGRNIDIDQSILLKCIKNVISQDNFFLKKPKLVIHSCNKKIVENIFLDFLKMHDWKLVYDDNIDCNSCTVVSESGNIDSTINARWQELCRLVYTEENA